MFIEIVNCNSFFPSDCLLLDLMRLKSPRKLVVAVSVYEMTERVRGILMNKGRHNYIHMFNIVLFC